MVNDRQRDALVVIGKHLKTELDREPPERKPDIDKALRRLLERHAISAPADSDQE